MAGKIISGFSNIDISKQIAVLEQSDGYVVAAGISRANQTISVYHGETLIFDCTMPSTGIGDLPTVMAGQATLHDESFSGFVQGEAYTIVAGEEAPVTGFYVSSGMLASFEADGSWAIFAFNGNVGAKDLANSHTKFSISQNVTTVKKRYDVKLLPDELLPKTVAKKVDVQKVQKIADNAQSTADNAQSTADNAQSTAISAKVIAQNAQSTANTAKSTANAAQSTANAAATKANPVFTGSFSQNRKADSTIGNFSHAEGYGTTASGYYSHAEGDSTTASNYCSHAEGDRTTASGNYSHAEGSGTTAIGVCSHAEGGGTTAIDNYSHAEGKYNIPDASRAYAHIVGNGLNDEERSNAHTLDWSGNAWFAGDVYVGSTSGTNKDNGSKKLATQEYADGKALGMDITGASVGQIIKIKSVDANGKPTEWESVDIVNLLPIYGGGVS